MRFSKLGRMSFSFYHQLHMSNLIRLSHLTLANFYKLAKTRVWVLQFWFWVTSSCGYDVEVRGNCEFCGGCDWILEELLMGFGNFDFMRMSLWQYIYYFVNLQPVFHIFLPILCWPFWICYLYFDINVSYCTHINEIIFPLITMNY